MPKLQVTKDDLYRETFSELESLGAEFPRMNVLVRDRINHAINYYRPGASKSWHWYYMKETDHLEREKREGRFQEMANIELVILHACFRAAERVFQRPIMDVEIPKRGNLNN